MRLINENRRRCTCCRDYLASCEELSECFSCRQIGTLRRGMYVGCTLSRHAQIGVHAVINAKARQVWRNNPAASIPNDRGLRAVAKHGTYSQYMQFRCR